jgi:nitroimidazol reductase NimA-like FMN-containing flavoprotein (pyridoxamine 5'-phosphate oxidase superfamily)
METRTSTEFTAEVESYLRNNHAVTISTSSFTGLPHANTAPYVSDDKRLYFFVRDESILLSNLDGTHHAAFTIDEYGPPWQKRRELHGTGTCGAADDHQTTTALALCAEKFGDFRPTGALWWLEPSGMYFIDYTF